MHIKSVISALSYAPGFGVSFLVVLGKPGPARKIGLADAFVVMKLEFYGCPFPVCLSLFFFQQTL